MAQIPAQSFAPVSRSAQRIALLGMIAGYGNALGFVELGGVFVGAMTGNTTDMGAALASGDWGHGLKVAAIVAVFFSSAVLARLVRRLGVPARGFLIMAGLLVLTQAVQGHPAQRVCELLFLPAFMAVQGETISRFSGTAIQTIVVTSNLLKCASAVAGWLASLWPGSTAQRPARGAILLPGMAWVAFFIGAMAATCALRLHAPLPFVWPLPLLAVLYADLGHAERQHEPE